MSNEAEPSNQSVLTTYISRIRAFQPNARFYLFSVLTTGATMGVFRLLFNFFVLSLDYDEGLLGNLITTSNLTALILAIPMGFVVDKLGRKQALILRTIILGSSILMMGIFPGVAIFYAMNAMFGVAQSLSAVAMGPFLMENSGKEERTYLFSFGQGIQMGSVFVGNWVGGYLPSWIGDMQNIDPTSSGAYAGAMILVALIGFLGLIPLSFIKSKKSSLTSANNFHPGEFVKNNGARLTRLFTPLLFVSVGAGFFVPFMNIYFREVHNQPDHVIGSLMAWGSLAMGVGLMIAPPIAERIGKLKLVTITQGLSIPFMIALGFAPWLLVAMAAYYVRMALMNMSNPIYQNFVLERFEEKDQATAASMHSMVWSFGRSFSPAISGNLQVEYGFGPPFAIAIAFYSLAIFLYWFNYIRTGKADKPVLQQQREEEEAARAAAAT